MLIKTDINKLSSDSEVFNNKWPDVCDAFQNEFGNSIYKAWISQLLLVSLNESEVTMSVPTGFIRDWISRDYLNGTYKIVDGQKVFLKKGIKQILLDFFPKLVSFNIIVDKEQNKKNENNSKNFVSDEKNIISISENGNLYHIGTELNIDYNFDNFVVGQSNKLAFKVAKDFSNLEESNRNINPLFIYGGVGLGKTHLCQSIAWDLKTKYSKKNIIYLSAEKFMFLFVQSIQGQSINEFKNKFRNIDVLVVDDIQFITGKDKTQKEFFYTFDTLVNEGKRIVLACDKAPANLENLDEKLKSRMNGGLIVDIKTPDYQFRLDLIRKKSKDFNLNMSEELFKFLAENLQTSCREIEGCLRRLSMNQNIMDVNLDKEYVINILSDNINQKVITIENIQEKVANFFDITLSGLKSDKKLKNLVLPRHIAMYLSKKLTNKSFSEIAKKFNGKNHATIIHGTKRISKLIEEDSQVFNMISDIENLLK